MNRAFIVMAAVLASVGLQVQARTEIPPGKWSFVFADPKGHAGLPMRVYTYRPARCDAKCPMVFSIHGVSRTASNYRDHWELAADRYNLVIVAPEFSKQHWAGYNEYDVRREPDREKWAFSAIEHLFDELGDGRKGYTIFGHSAGGQFVHRMAFYLPANRAEAMVAANPGWYAMPECHKDLKRIPQAMKQGATRLERGENYFRAVTATAAALGEKLAWELREVPAVAHEGAPMSRYAADMIFGAK